MNRLDAVELFLERNPQERFGIASVVLDDLNLEDDWLLRTANTVVKEFAAHTIAGDAESAAKMVKLLIFVLALSDLPLPDSWQRRTDELAVCDGCGVNGDGEPDCLFMLPSGREEVAN